MRLSSLLVGTLACLSVSAHASPTMFSIEEAMNHPTVQQALKPGIKVLWGSQKPEGEEVERAAPDTYSASDYGASFAAKKGRCMDLFASAMQDVLRDAQLREYDFIELRGIYDDKISSDANMYICDIGFRGIDVKLEITFVQTRAGLASLEKTKNDPTLQAAIRDRKLAPDTLLLPLKPMLESPEGQALLRGITPHIGIGGAPAYVTRFGPGIYDEDASISRYGREGACKKAVLAALENMVSDVRDKKFNGLVMIRSYYKGLWAPDDQQVECDVAGRSAMVQLVGTAVKLK